MAITSRRLVVNTMPEVLGWMYDSLDKPWENERRRLALDRLNAAGADNYGIELEGRALTSLASWRLRLLDQD